MNQNKLLIKLFLFIVILIPASIIYAQKQDLDKLLDLNLEELMNIEIITASKMLQKLNEVPATVRVITAEQIKERGYFTLEEALSDLPGFQFRNIVGFNSYVFLRGIQNQNQATLLLVDGIQINELNSGGFYAGGQYNLANVKRIEVVYGPASVIYGTNALSGIINIITNNPEDIQGGRASVLFGSFDTKNYDFTYGHYNQNNDYGFSISGMFKQSDKADLREAKGDNNWTNNMENFEDDLSFDGKVTYKNLSMGLVFQNKQASRTTNYKTIGANYLDSGTIWNIRFINSHIKYIYKKSSKWYNQSQLYYRNATVMDHTIAFIKSDIGANGGQTGYYRPNNLFGFENQTNLQLDDKLSLIAGFVFEKEKLAQGFSKTFSGDPGKKPPKPPKPDMISNGLASVYLQTQYKFAESTELTFGLRHDNSSYYGKVFTPRIGLVYNKNELTTKLLYTEAFRAPKPWDYTYEEGNPDLEPETMKSLEIALGYVYSENFVATLSVYKNNMKGTFVREELRQTNGPDVKTDGFELGLDYVWGQIRSYFNYTYNLSIYEHGETVPEIGNNNINAGILFAITRQLKIDVRGHYLGTRKNVKTISATASDYVDHTFVVNSTLSFLDLNGFDFQIIVNNLLDTEYYHTSNNPPDRYRQPQRRILLRVKYEFFQN